MIYPVPPAPTVNFNAPPDPAGDLPTFTVNLVVDNTSSIPKVELWAGSDTLPNNFTGLGYEWVVVCISCAQVNVNVLVPIPTVLFAFCIPLAAAETYVCALTSVDGVEFKTWISKVLEVTSAICIHLLKIGSVLLG